MTHYKDENNKNILLISDGSNKIFHVDPENFSIQKTISIYNSNKLPYNNLNE